MNRSLTVVISTVIISVAIAFGFYSFGAVLDDGNYIDREHGLIENFQVFLLIITFGVYVMLAILSKEKARLIFLFFALLCYSFILREVTLWKLDVPYTVKLIGSGIGRDISISLGFSFIFLYAFKNYDFYKKASIELLEVRTRVLLGLTLLCLLIGAYFDKKTMILFHQYYEEISEFFAYIFFLLSALANVPYLNNTMIRFWVPQNSINETTR